MDYVYQSSCSSLFYFISFLEAKSFSSMLIPLPLNVPLVFLKANHMRANYHQETHDIAPSSWYQAIFLSHPQFSS